MTVARSVIEAPPGLRSHCEERDPVSKSIILTSGQITPTDSIKVELVQPDSMPAAVKVTWPLQATVADPRRFPDVAATVAKLFATAATALAAINAGRRI